MENKIPKQDSVKSETASQTADTKDSAASESDGAAPAVKTDSRPDKTDSASDKAHHFPREAIVTTEADVRVDPPESTFKKLLPSETRYTLLRARDEL